MKKNKLLFSVVAIVAVSFTLLGALHFSDVDKEQASDRGVFPSAVSYNQV